MPGRPVREIHGADLDADKIEADLHFPLHINACLTSCESPLGLVPTQIDYGDYRKTDDVEIPFRQVVAQPGGNSVIQLEQIQQNASVNVQL